MAQGLDEKIFFLNFYNYGLLEKNQIFLDHYKQSLFYQKLSPRDCVSLVRMENYKN